MLSYHYILYAYPGSSMAIRHGFAETGCYSLESNLMKTYYPTYESVVEAALLLGTKPERYSMDHPLEIQSRQVLI